MARFTGTFTFVRVIGQEYHFAVEANTEEEAIIIIKENPFNYVTATEPIYEDEESSKVNKIIIEKREK